MRRSSARFLTVGLVVLLLIGAAAFALSGRDHRVDVSPRANKPSLMLLTTLPLIFSEEFSLEGGGSKALTALETRYKVVPISTTDAAALQHGRMLLLAHPLAQPAESLVDLDRWVRDGGRVLLLADPRLDWPSNRPLGDKLRPPPSFADTGLLAHWGLKLQMPDDPGPVVLGGGHSPIIYPSPGRLASTNPDCELSRADIVAECVIGRGKIAVVADADFLNPDVAETNQGSAENQMGELLELLSELER